MFPKVMYLKICFIDILHIYKKKDHEQVGEDKTFKK